MEYDICKADLGEDDQDELYITGDGWNGYRYEFCSWKCLALFAQRKVKKNKL